MIPHRAFTTAPTGAGTSTRSGVPALSYQACSMFVPSNGNVGAGGEGGGLLGGGLFVSCFPLITSSTAGRRALISSTIFS